ncbi:ABC transporter substrate-binding protein [Brevibacterium sp.]|uniref:ABC transporter substrate-binding protein n=1 Tax=Brevibacterium sp. TaxID=1701 RepID=UPI0025C177A6|nr:ABC transporter substrate-binding protein [Brevibacterium sp.]
MRRQTLLAGLAGLLVLILGTGCTAALSHGDHGDRLDIALGSQPTNLDEQTLTGSPTKVTMRNVFETLVTTDAQNEVVPVLAESWTISDDGRTYTFKLREGVKFHTGEEMTSEDVVESMNRWIGLYQVAQATMGEDAHFVEDGKYTVKLLLEEPSIGVLGLLATHKQFPSIMPAEIVRDADPTGVTEFIGTGPYEFVEWKKDQYIHMTRFDDYESPPGEPSGMAGTREPLMKDLYFHIVTDPATQLAGLQTGRYDIAPDVSPDAYEWLKSAPEFALTTYTTGDLVFAFNFTSPVMEDELIRKAVQIGTSSSDIMDVAMGDSDLYELKAGYMATEQLAWETDAGKDTYDKRDVDLAKKYIEESSYAGQPIRILTSRDDLYQYKGSVVLQEQLKALGFDVTLRAVEWATYSALSKDEGSFDIVAAGVTPVTDPTQISYLGTDWTFAESPRVRDDLQKIKIASSQAEALEIWEETQKYLREEYVPVLMAGEFKGLAATREDIEGFTAQYGPIVWNTEATS